MTNLTHEEVSIGSISFFDSWFKLKTQSVKFVKEILHFFTPLKILFLFIGQEIGQIMLFLQKC